MFVFFVNACLEKRTLKLYYMNNQYCCKTYFIQSLMHNVVANSMRFSYIPCCCVRRVVSGFIRCSEHGNNDHIQCILGWILLWLESRILQLAIIGRFQVFLYSKTKQLTGAGIKSKVLNASYVFARGQRFPWVGRTGQVATTVPVVRFMRLGRRKHLLGDEITCWSWIEHVSVLSPSTTSHISFSTRHISFNFCRSTQPTEHLTNRAVRVAVLAVAISATQRWQWLIPPCE